MNLKSTLNEAHAIGACKDGHLQTSESGCFDNTNCMEKCLFFF